MHSIEAYLNQGGWHIWSVASRIKFIILIMKTALLHMKSTECSVSRETCCPSFPFPAQLRHYLWEGYRDTRGRASLIIWRKATHFVESCHSKYWSTKQSVVLQDLICAVQGKAQVSLSMTEEQFSKVSASTNVSLTPLIWQKVLGKQIGCAMHIMHIVHLVHLSSLLQVRLCILHCKLCIGKQISTPSSAFVHFLQVQPVCSHMRQLQMFQKV